jgi:hypothetical protein
MTAQTILRFWTLIACFLKEQRSAAPDQRLTCGDVRRNLQHQHRLNLLQWLEASFIDGYTFDQV